MRQFGICQKPVITLYETPDCAEYSSDIAVERTDVPKNGGVADEILFGWQYEVLEKKNACYKIRTHYGYEGWIAAKDRSPVESADVQNGGRLRQLCQVCQNIADVLEADRVQARRITTLYAGSLIWAEKDPAAGDSRVVDGNAAGIVAVAPADGNGTDMTAAPTALQPGWRRVFLPDGIGGLREGFMRSRFLEPCRGQERWMECAPQRLPILAERMDAVSQSELAEREDADASRSRSEETLRESIVRIAYSYLGTQYRWGGKTASGIDCSGLAFMSYFQNGILIWRDAAIKEGYPVHEILIEQAKPGDLLFFRGHVAIYLGNGKIIHATGHPDSSCVTVNSLREGETGYREDLKNSLYAAGSVFANTDLG